MTVGRHFTIDEAVDNYAPMLSKRKLRRYVDERTIPFTKVGNRIYFAETDLDALIAKGKVEAVPQRATILRSPAREARVTGSLINTRHRRQAKDSVSATS